MKIVTPPKPIHTSEIVDDEIVVTIPVKKRWFEIIIFLWFLTIITPPLYFLGRAIILYLLFSVGLYGDVPSVSGDATTNVPGTIGGLLFVVIVLLLIELWIIYSLLWRFAGKEIVSANKDLLIVAQKLFNWKPYKAYKTSDISALRISRLNGYQNQLFSDLKSLFGHAGIIAFDYGAKTFRFGNGLDEVEAKQITKKIQLHLSSVLPQFAVDSKVNCEEN